MVSFHQTTSAAWCPQMLDLGRSWPQGPRGVGLVQTVSGSLAQESITARKVRSEVTLSAVGRLGAVPPTVGPCGLVESQRTSIMRFDGQYRPPRILTRTHHERGLRVSRRSNCRRCSGSRLSNGLARARSRKAQQWPSQLQQRRVSAWVGASGGLKSCVPPRPPSSQRYVSRGTGVEDTDRPHRERISVDMAVGLSRLRQSFVTLSPPTVLRRVCGDGSTGFVGWGGHAVYGLSGTPAENARPGVAS